MSVTEAPQPGWYPDTEMVNTLRYWDGAAWTAHRAPMPPPVWSGWTPPKVSPFLAVKNFWRRAFTYSGRATRAEYNWTLALFLGVYFGLVAITGVLGLQNTPAGAAIIVPVMLAFLVPWPALIARRCHDMNRPGVFGLLFLASGIGFLITEGFMVFAGSNPLGARFETGSPYAIALRNAKRSRPIGIAAGAFVLLAGIATIAPIIEITDVASRPVVVLGQGPQHVELPAHTQYGLFFDDPHNLGYSESCVATDRGVSVALNDPGFYMTSSDTENLDMVFNTGSGHLVVNCQSTAAQISARPIPNYAAILIGIGVSVLLGLIAFVLIILWIARVGARLGPIAATDASIPSVPLSN